MPEGGGGALGEGWMIVIRFWGSIQSLCQVINNKRRKGKYYDVGCQDIFGYY